MQTRDILITINSLSDIDKLKELGINNYVCPLKDFCVGIPNTFCMEEIGKINGYILINRILDNEGIDKLKQLIKKIPSSIKGIIFDDLGVLSIIKDLKIEKILYLSHFNSNVESIAIYLNFVDTLIASTDITKNEIEYIVDKFPNKLTLFTLGYIKSMYSRRLLIDNYTKFYNIEYKNPLEIDNTNHEFLVYENEYGTCFYHKPLFNGLELMNLPCKYYFINSTFLDISDIEELLNNTYKKDTDRAFLDNGTIYKIKGDNNG